MHVTKNAPHLLGGGWLTEAGSYIGKTARGILDVGGKAIGIITSKGGTAGTDVYDENANAGPGIDPTMAIAVAGLAVVGVVVLTKRRKKSYRR